MNNHSIHLRSDYYFLLFLTVMVHVKSEIRPGVMRKAVICFLKPFSSELTLLSPSSYLRTMSVHLNHLQLHLCLCICLCAFVLSLNSPPSHTCYVSVHCAFQCGIYNEEE